MSEIPRCKITNCTSNATSTGLCKTHANYKKSGRPIKPIPAAWTTSEQPLRDVQFRPEPELLDAWLARPDVRALEESLPAEDRDTFRNLAADYRAAARAFHGIPVVSAPVIAELVKLGWRCPT